MTELYVRNVNEALQKAVPLIKQQGLSYPSRNGTMLEMAGLVVTTYERPQERVLFNEERDANPYFHFFECLWMIAGRNDLAFVKRFVKNMETYSDDGKTLNGSAYGWRWRHHFRKSFNTEGKGDLLDQISQVIKMLKENPNDRRAVLQMWDPQVDLGSNSKDIPCNTCVYLKLRDNILDITVSNRSNDVVWGAYGANAVHFSFLHEYLAMCLGAGVGRYHQVSNSFHVYTENEVWKAIENLEGYKACPYEVGTVTPYELKDTDVSQFEMDLQLFFADPAATGFQTEFFLKVVKPMYWAHEAFKKKEFKNAFELNNQVIAKDWQLGCDMWLKRKEQKYVNKRQSDQGTLV